MPKVHPDGTPKPAEKIGAEPVTPAVPTPAPERPATPAIEEQAEKNAE